MNQLVIRAVEPGDAVALKQLFAHPEVYRETLQLPYLTHAEWLHRTQSPPQGSHKLVAVLDGQVVGQIGLAVEANARRRHVANVGLGVHPQFSGQGVGSRLLGAVIELCEGWLNVQRIELTVYTDNVAAIALYEKFDFVIEGTSRGYAFRDGVYQDVYQMARCRLPSLKPKDRV